MTTWVIVPTYKYDLANFCNLFTEDEFYTSRHPEAYAYFKDRFDRKLVPLARKALQERKLIGPTAAYLLSHGTAEGQDIKEITRDLETASRKFPDHLSTIELVRKLLLHANELGFAAYWRENCLPHLVKRCAELKEDAGKYPVVEAAAEMLGVDHAAPPRSLLLHICHFAAPHGSSLSDKSFVSDCRWPMNEQVFIALHEQMHPPFAGDEIGKIAELLWEDKFVRFAHGLLPPTHGYATAAGFVEENIVEGAHVYLAEQIELDFGKTALEYFADHDFGSHVLSVLIYDALKKGIRKESQVHSLRDAIFSMLDRGMLKAGQIYAAYRKVFEEAGQQHLNPFKDKSFS